VRSAGKSLGSLLLPGVAQWMSLAAVIEVKRVRQLILGSFSFVIVPSSSPSEKALFVGVAQESVASSRSLSVSGRNHS
jgi:hypothetical protein